VSAERDRPAGWPEGFADGRANRRASLVLSALRGITPLKLLELAHREGSAFACLAAICTGRAGSEGDREFAREMDPAAMEEALVACGARFVPFGTTEYPPQLENLVDPPATLFVLGDPLPGRAGSVAVVGARNCSELGRDLAQMIGRDLASSGMCVVSGAARGIDAAAHQGALAARGHTVAVLGCGIDQVYPKDSRALIARIAESGTLVSEYAPGVPPEPFRFPARNRIIAALATALVVVEGADGSGSMISAEHALDLGRTVFAVPGAITNPLAFVPHALIREGATLIRGVDDLLHDLELSGVPPALARLLDVSPAERAALDLITEPVLPERVAGALGLSIPEILPVLIELEMKGLVRSVGGRFEPRIRALADDPNLAGKIPLSDARSGDR
jgi:DNA processing protein